MSSKAAVIASLIYQIQQSYKQKGLTEKGQIELNKTINEMEILSVIYQKCSQTNRQIIDKEMLRFQKRLKEQSRNTGGFFSWVGWSETQVVNLDQVWPSICKITQPECQFLLQDIKQLKMIE